MTKWYVLFFFLFHIGCYLLESRAGVTSAAHPSHRAATQALPTTPDSAQKLGVGGDSAIMFAWLQEAGALMCVAMVCRIWNVCACMYVYMFVWVSEWVSECVCVCWHQTETNKQFKRGVIPRSMSPPSPVQAEEWRQWWQSVCVCVCVRVRVRVRVCVCVHVRAGEWRASVGKVDTLGSGQIWW